LKSLDLYVTSAGTLEFTPAKAMTRVGVFDKLCLDIYDSTL